MTIASACTCSKNSFAARNVREISLKLQPIDFGMLSLLFSRPDRLRSFAGRWTCDKDGLAAGIPTDDYELRLASFIFGIENR